MLAGVVAFGGAVPEEEPALERCRIVLELIIRMLGLTHVCEVRRQRNWTLCIAVALSESHTTSDSLARLTWTHSLNSGWRSPREACVMAANDRTVMSAVALHLEVFLCRIMYNYS